MFGKGLKNDTFIVNFSDGYVSSSCVCFSFRAVRFGGIFLKDLWRESGESVEKVRFGYIVATVYTGLCYGCAQVQKG